jgi:hypothetical protein
MAVVACVAAGCAGSDEGAAGAGEEQAEAPLFGSSSPLYFYVSAAQPGSIGGPLVLRRANAKPTTLSPTYGAPTLPAIKLAADATATQAQLDALIATPYAGHEQQVLALVAGRDASTLTSGPLEEITEIYLPSQPIAIAQVAQKDALYQLVASASSETVRLVNEKDFAASASVAVDATGAVDAAAAHVAVAAGARFVGTIDQQCSKILWITSCQPPSAVHVAAYFAKP